MPGRKPKPTKLKVLEGNPGKRPLNNKEPAPDSDLPSYPPHLDDIGRQEWDRVASELKELGILTGIDMAVFAAYCHSYSVWVDAAIKIQKSGTIIKAPSGYPVQNPLVSVARNAQNQMLKALVELGMTPSSRSRITIEPKEKKNAILDRKKRKKG